MNPTNNAQLIGNLTRDPELRTTRDYKTVCNMRIAVEGLAGPSSTGYIDVSCWGKPGEACARELTKGAQVAVAGALQLRPWEADGKKGIDVSLPAATVKFLNLRRSDTSRSTAQPDDDVPF